MQDLWRGGAGAHLADDILMTFVGAVFVEQVHDAEFKGCALIFVHAHWQYPLWQVVPHHQPRYWQACYCLGAWAAL